MYTDKFELLKETLTKLGFSMIFTDTPLKVALEGVKYPLAVVTINNAVGDSDMGWLNFSIAIMLLWPNYGKFTDYENYLYSCNQAQGLASALDVQDYRVTPVQHHAPDVSGGLMVFTMKSNVAQICPPE